jgi:ferredoxin-NADP reductase/Na+-translocating ferredoxin:NAD+ oxidoreductase RnfD subunit
LAVRLASNSDDIFQLSHFELQVKPLYTIFMFNPLRFIDDLLNRITMYKLVLYYLFILLLVAIVCCFTGLMAYSGLDLISSSVILMLVCYVTNLILAKIFGVTPNSESSIITALILTFIITPGAPVLFLSLAGSISQASKYILNFRGKHIFNPAAVAVIFTIFLIGQGASWWIGNQYILPVIVVGGLLIARKVQRFGMIFTFIAVHLMVTDYFSPSKSDLLVIVENSVLYSSLIYFATVMLTEPLTSPTRKYPRLVYAALVGVLSAYQFNFGSLYASPELALVIGNIFTFIVSDKARYKLILKSKEKIADGIYNFRFETNRKINFKPGQYLEWTLGHKNPDLRGNRRYFTIASSPTESDIILGVRFYEKSSSFKNALLELNPGDRIFAGQLAGDFVLPTDKSKKLVFIAGGIGVTPFRSMIKYMIDTDEKREITLFYSNRNESEVAFKEILDQAKQRGLKINLVITDRDGWVNKEMIERGVPDFRQNLFYISGSRHVVDAFRNMLLDMGVNRGQIKEDFFPGFV